MVCLISQSKLDDEALGRLTLSSAPGGDVISGELVARHGSGCVHVLVWAAWPKKKKRKREKEKKVGKKKIKIWVCSHGGVSVLGAGPREQQGADLVGRPPDLLRHPSDSSAKTHVFSPRKKTASSRCLLPATQTCLAPACPGPQRSGAVAHPDLILQPPGCCSFCA